MTGDHEEQCNIGLCLGLGVGERFQKNNKKPVPVACLDFSCTLCPKEEAMDVHHKPDKEYVYNYSHSDKNINSRRKKMRLTKEQSSFLEDSFKVHTTLNSSQKRALAEQLNLKARQVEVWFQNRRARIKLKQTEVDCEFFKKCSESLNEENKRLKKELQELRSTKFEQSPLFIPKATAMCPLCEKIIRTSG